MKKIITAILPLIMFHLTIQAQTIQFTDPNFKAAILENGVDQDKDKEIQLNEAEAVMVLDISSKNVSDLTGIEYFTNLKELSCNWNSLTTIDLSKNINLEGLYCASNQIVRIDLSKNEMLKSLTIDENPLVNLNLSANSELTKLTCSSTQLSALDLSKNIKLTSLNCTKNPGLQFISVSSVASVINNKKFKKDDATQWNEKKSGQSQRR